MAGNKRRVMPATPSRCGQRISSGFGASGVL